MTPLRFELHALKKKRVRGIGVFPFTQGMCSQLPDTFVNEISNLKGLIRDRNDDTYTLRLLKPQDSTSLHKVLNSYGHSEQNFGDLEFFPEDKMDIILKNMTTCAAHRYFLSFGILDGRTVIGFIQLDPYNCAKIEENFSQNVFPNWNKFLDTPLDGEKFKNSSLWHLENWIQRHIRVQDFEAFREKYAIKVEYLLQSWTEYIVESCRCFQILSCWLRPDQYIANLSYCLLPQYQSLSIMSAVLRQIMQWLRKTPIVYLFSDRISEKNAASYNLLRKAKFIACSSFKTFYTENYHTRTHPCGNFSENCICLGIPIAD